MKTVAKIVKGLRAASSNGWETNQAFFEWAASLKVTPRETTYDELQAALKLNRAAARSYAVDIEEAGIGERIFGRRTFKSRIRWKYTLKSVADAARGFRDTLEELSDSNFPATNEADDASPPRVPIEEAEHVFQLRRDRRVQFRLPKDLSAREADRLAAFIKTLPLE